ncbi:MAG: hypothetical protein ACRDSL_15935 [Pseudonocardiaceae bacterium]
MSTEQDNIQSADGTSDKGKQSRQAMRGDWSGWKAWTAEDQANIDIKECTDARCMNVEVNVGYQGLVDNSVLSQSAEVGNDLRAAWKTKLEGEGKLNAEGKSLRDTIFGTSEPKQ